MQVFVIIRNIEIMVNVDVNGNKVCGMDDKVFVWNPITVNENVINHRILENISIMHFVSLEKD